VAGKWAAARMDGRVDGTLRPHDRRRKEYVVSNTLERVDWNAELVRGDLLSRSSSSSGRQGRQGTVRGRRDAPAGIAELGLIDDYEFVVPPQAGGPRADVVRGLSKYVDLKLVSRREFGSGAVALRYEREGSSSPRTDSASPSLVIWKIIRAVFNQCTT